MKTLLFTIFLIGIYSFSYSANYGSMYISSSSTDLVSGTLTASTELQLTGYSAMENSGWSYNNNSLSAEIVLPVSICLDSL